MESIGVQQQVGQKYARPAPAVTESADVQACCNPGLCCAPGASGAKQ